MNDWKPRMTRTVRLLAEQLATIRSGTVDPGLVSSVRARSGGNAVPIRRLAAVTARGDRLVVRPFDPGDVPAVVRALTDANLSAYAMDPTSIAVSVPPISGEQRQAMARRVKALGEEARVAVRMIRQDARKQIAARGRGSERAVQEATDLAVAEIDRLVAAKVAEIGG
ncbi:ribosome-recycling factor [Tautonia plasticadhaerens]|uniref:Ribosome-recycling factor n=1 Tax=Tautonia plasticadhaerens TaxID=2527974 RepID=A0A518H6T5_9BACT|nr:ribosome-recycling factor [Tautonia plasticadhaerens]QDV36587.1 Ribosome-recycling factor [Tautonia plasticadhaerens]